MESHLTSFHLDHKTRFVVSYIGHDVQKILWAGTTPEDLTLAQLWYRLGQILTNEVNPARAQMEF